MAGIELMRGMAAFAVIFIHSGLVVHDRCTLLAAQVRDWGRFAVPFFLITAFFFALATPRPSWREGSVRNARRLLVPFVCWSLFYFLLRTALFLIRHQREEIMATLAHPVALVLSGGASVALYFIPVLITGLILCRFLGGWLRWAPAWQATIFLLVAIALQRLAQSHLDPVSILAYAARCLPLIAAAALLGRGSKSLPNRGFDWILAAGILELAAILIAARVASFPEVFAGSAAWMLAWGLSAYLPMSRWIACLGEYSFGIYLVHQAVLEMIQTAFDHGFPAVHAPLGLPAMLAITLAAFLVSMGVVALAARGNTPCRHVFGLRQRVTLTTTESPARMRFS